METTSILNNNFSNLLSWFFSTKSNYVFEKEPWNEKLFSKILCEMYHSFKTKNKKKKTKKSPILNTFNNDDYNCDFLSPIKKIITQKKENKKKFHSKVFKTSYLIFN